MKKRKNKTNPNEPTEVEWAGEYGCMDQYHTDESGKVIGIGVVGTGIQFYPRCPHCGDFAYQQDDRERPDGNYACPFCGGLQNPIDWEKRPAPIPDDD